MRSKVILGSQRLYSEKLVKVHGSVGHAESAVFCHVFAKSNILLYTLCQQMLDLKTVITLSTCKFSHLGISFFLVSVCGQHTVVDMCSLETALKTKCQNKMSIFFSCRPTLFPQLLPYFQVCNVYCTLFFIDQSVINLPYRTVLHFNYSRG